MTRHGREESALIPVGWGLVDTIDITNFRGFAHLSVPGLARVNLIVGDNGVGKTAFLEAIFLTVSGQARMPMNLKQWRGMDFGFSTSSRDSLVEGLYGDLFHDPQSDDPVIIKTTGRGFENRQLVIEKTSGDMVVPLEPTGNRRQRRAQKSGKKLELQEATVSPISLTWTDERDEEHVARVLLTPNAVNFQGTGETLPNCFMYAAQIPVPVSESANHYSALRKRRDTERFRSVFMKVFSEIIDISVETEGPVTQLLADVPWAKQLLPLAAYSGGTNRAAAILLAMTFRQDGLVLVDEVESGIYHGRQNKFAEALLALSRSYQTQLVMTSHSEEWLEKFIEAADDNDDVAFWRLERDAERRPIMKRFTVAEFRSGMAMGEMR